MSIKSRMEGFEKIANKEAKEDVRERMDEFEKVPQAKGKVHGRKTGDLPYGLKRYIPCEICGDMMEVCEVNQGFAIYKCTTCHQSAQIKTTL